MLKMQKCVKNDFFSKKVIFLLYFCSKIDFFASI